MNNITFSLLTSFLITFFAIPSIIKVAEIKHLFDLPGERKSHRLKVPTLGGIAIFAGLISSLTFWSNQSQIIELQFIINSILILFFMGIKDDLFDLVAYKKLLGQLAASTILVHYANIRLTTFYGLFSINDLSLLPSYALSIFSIIVITNSINLIDGVDCLAGMVGIVAGSVFGYWFWLVGAHQYSILSFSLVGSLLAFLWYNKSPAKIFMGDTGSLILGLCLSILAIKFIEMNRVLPREHTYKVLSVPVVTIGVLIIPLFDLLRVFTLRILDGRSPLSADRKHLHHLLLDMGFTHLQTTSTLLIFNIFIIFLTFILQGLKGEHLLMIEFGLCLLFSFIISIALEKKRSQETISSINIKAQRE